MYFVYILENKEGVNYTGITALKPLARLKRHNRGEVYSTRRGLPWNLVYSEIHDSMKSARQREKQIKSWHGGNALKKLLGKAAG